MYTHLPGFERLGIMEELVHVVVQRGFSMILGKAMSAYHFVLEEFYNVENDFDYAITVTVKDEEAGLDRSFKLTFDMRFSSVQHAKTPPKLSKADIKRLRADRMNIDLWKELLPPDDFSFSGFVVVTAVDVTDTEMVSLLKLDLLQKDAMDSDEKLDQLQHRVRSLMRRPDLELGLISLERGKMEEVTGVRPVTRSLHLGKGDEGNKPKHEEYKDSIYKMMCDRRCSVTISDLKDYDRSPFEDRLLKKGIRNIMVTPMYHDDEFIGIIELGSPNPGDLHSLNTVKLMGVETLFATALKRNMDEQENIVQAVIKEHYTAIHPAVEWRFREAANAMLAKSNNGEIS